MAKWSASQKRYFADFHFDLFDDSDGSEFCMGFDFSKTSTGYGVVNLNNGNMVEHGLIETGRKEHGSDYKRFGKIYSDILDLLREFHPVFIGYESVRVKTQISSFKDLSMALSAFSIARYKAESKGFFKPYVISFNPSHIKTVSTAGSDAEKQDVVSGIEEYYGLDDLSDDEADALACCKLGWYFTNVQGAYESARNMSVSNIDDPDDAYEFLLDVYKRRNTVFETCLASYKDEGVDAVLGAISGPAGLNNLSKNSISTYYEAMDKVKKLYGD